MNGLAFGEAREVCAFFVVSGTTPIFAPFRLCRTNTVATAATAAANRIPSLSIAGNRAPE